MGFYFSFKKNGGNDRAEWQMESFRNFMNVFGFHDVPFRIHL